VAACGGGGGDEAAPVAGPAPASLSLTGTAAVGAALASAAVSVKCVGGSGSATTAADGSFSVAITGASLPCVLSVSSGSTTLRSVAEAGSATSAVANITPLSELIVARLAGGDAASLFNNFDAAAQAKLGATGLSDARTAVTAALKGVIDLTGVDPIKSALVAASTGKEGNALDKQLDALGLALKAAGTDIAAVAAAIQANGTAPAVVQTLLQPVAASCAGLRSGKYRLLDAYAGSIAAATALVSIDAVKGEYTTAGVTKSFKAAEGSACQFVLPEGAGTAYVAASGLMVLRYLESPNVARAAVLLPEQSVPVAELAGNWNILTYGAEVAGGTLTPGYSTETLDATGKTTAGADCKGTVCEAWTPQASDVFAADAAGGFTVSDPDGSKARVFAFKTAGGQISLLGLMFDAKGLPLGLVAAAKQSALGLPQVGDVLKFWDAEVNWSGISSPTDVEMTVTAVDTAAKTSTRKRKSDGRVDTFAVNSPRDGLRYRAFGSSVLDNGTTLNFAESTTLPLPGTGISVSSGFTRSGGSHFTVTVAKP
ncbi:MAG TPA: hypothetical protein VJN44_16860, partial [Roseateles sp.]|nr:hypothetical protein [Roseateles sp.]